MTETQTLTGSLTQTPSTSQAATRTLSSTQSPSPTVTGRPVQAIFGNLGALLHHRALRAVSDKTGVAAAGAAASPAPRRLAVPAPLDVTANDEYGIAFRFSENDPVCGPGQYLMKTLYLYLSAPADANVSVSIQLWQSFGDPSQAQRAITSATIEVFAAAAVAVVPLTSAFVVDSSVDGAVDYTLVFQVSAGALRYICYLLLFTAFIPNEPAVQRRGLLGIRRRRHDSPDRPVRRGQRDCRIRQRRAVVRRGLLPGHGAPCCEAGLLPDANPDSKPVGVAVDVTEREPERVAKQRSDAQHDRDPESDRDAERDGHADAVGNGKRDALAQWDTDAESEWQPNPDDHAKR